MTFQKKKNRTAPSESKVLTATTSSTNADDNKKRISNNLSLSDHSQSKASKAKVSVESSWMKNECFCLPDVSNLKLIKTLDKTIISLQNKQKFFFLSTIVWRCFHVCHLKQAWVRFVEFWIGRIWPISLFLLNRPIED